MVRQTRSSFLRLATAGMIAAPYLRSEAAAAEAPLSFEFHSAFWENLHHRLYMQAQAYEAVRRGDHLNPTDSAWSALASDSWQEYQRLSQPERKQWERALQIYANGLADMDLLDAPMASIDAAVSHIDDRADVPKSSILHPATIQALTIAAPVYRATLWHADDAANRRWIAAVAPHVSDHSAPLTSRLEGWYRSPWPVGPYRVDVTRYANWAGCYTNTDPIHIIMSSRDFVNNRTHAAVPNSRRTALEMVFHEASHTVVTPGYGTVGTAIENGATELRKPEPDGLWHAVIFYTAGRAVGDEFPAAQYQMFADAVDIYTHGWEPYRKALIDHWQPYLDGKRPFDEALKDVVAAASA
ncbi:MAG: hypothetical protein JO060_06850 [Candidatus Eremiobacteraeota bacterium]|nr:hypothetical protein [Candidatus Eremiobacteraeota bacterium]